MMHRKIFAMVFLILLVGTIFSASYAEAQSFGTQSSFDDRNYASSRDNFYDSNSYDSDFRYRSSFSGVGDGSRYTSYYSRPSFQTYYGAQLSTYWPVLGDKATCEAREDILLGVAPAGCQPTVVRSDLLAEQDVPVFCQIDALKINPLLNIDSIRNIRFVGKYPKEVVGSGFHPARAALRTRDVLLGAPLVNNVGYIVVVLKRQPDESKLPDFINVTLSAQVEYNAKNALGVGRSEFIVKPSLTEDEWKKDRTSQSFWKGRYFLRLERVDDKFADVSIYDGASRITSERLQKGQNSREIFVPGFYCQAGLQFVYDGLTSVKDKARIEISTNGDSEIFDVVEEESFLDGRCVVKDIEIKNDGAGKISLSCGGKRIELKLDNGAGEFGFLGNNTGFEIKKSGEDYLIDLNDYKNETRKGVYILSDDNTLHILRGTEQAILINSSGGFDSTIKNDLAYRKWLRQLWNSLKSYKENPERGFGFENKVLDSEIKVYYDDAIKNYERIADEFSAEREFSFEQSARYGEKALDNAIQLAGDLGQNAEKQRLTNKFLQIYGDSSFTQKYLDELNSLKEFDASGSVEVVDFDGEARTVRLVSLISSLEDVGVVLNIEGKKLPIGLRETKNLTRGGTKHGEIVLEDIKPEEVRFGYYCTDERGNLLRAKNRTILRQGQEQEICGLDVRVDEIKVKPAAKIRILPTIARGTKTETNLSVTIGIEKGAIKLNPDKTRDRIEELNKTIKKWEKISENLGNVVSGLKTACFATSALLNFKNFFSGLSGEAIARQEVMRGPNGWKSICGDDDSCYLQHASEIDRDVAAYTNVINSINAKIQEIQGRSDVITSSDLFGTSVDAKKVKELLAQEARAQYGTVPINTMGLKGEWGDRGQVQLNEILSPENADGYSVDSIRNFMLYADLKNNGQLSESQRENTEKKLKDMTGKVNDNVLDLRQLQRANQLKQRGLASPFYDVSLGNMRPAEIVGVGDQLKQKYDGIENYSHSATFVRNGEVYVLGLEESEGARKIYSTKKIWKEDGTLLLDQDAKNITKESNIGSLRDSGSVRYNNQIVQQDRIVKYYETQPYRGMPAIVPFDTRNGWYAATRQNLPVFGGIGAFDSSGRVTSFELCNVGENEKIEIFSGYGDDLCQVINLNTGQPLGFYPGLSEQEARNKVSEAIQAITEAARQYENQFVTINGERMKADVTVAQSGTRCQDFMSPKDCHLLFNVCDPVICPSSRCDLGGAYRVANVVQTGIVGSIFLCLPNIKEGIVIPVCLTGIHAGIVAFTSILKNHRDCLQENLATGKLVGICDEIYSIYLCEFFWRQVAPFVNILIPKLIELAYGQGVRGGGEYLTVMSAWQNTENSINYFTQQYAVNSLQAFQARSEGAYGSYGKALATGNVFELGGEFCKSWTSAKAPKAFQTLVEPDSPPQFSAWFDQIKFSDATVPATAQYKVFYHIFAGNDQGVHFSVYLKNPPEGGYYTTAPVLTVVPSKFIPRGEYASETKDFTAPEGYKELCVRINTEEYCGFKQVSSSFAVNYLRDTYVNSEITKEGIKTERECISGSQNPGALANPNVQFGLEETALPEIYNRGVVRICSTQNPGLTTNPKRFVNVGYCNDPKVGCWIDTRSVDNAITSSNIGLKNETLQVLEERSIDYLAREGQILFGDDAKAELDSLEEELTNLNGKDKNKARDVLIKVDNVFTKLFDNNDKARLLMIKAMINEKVVRASKAEKDARTQESRKIETEPSQPPTTQPSEQPQQEIEKATVTENKKYNVKQETISNKSVEMIYLYTEKTNIYIAPLGDKIYYDIENTEDQEIGVLSSRTDIGTVEIFDFGYLEDYYLNSYANRERTIQHLKFLDGKRYQKLKIGALECDPAIVSDCTITRQIVKDSEKCQITDPKWVNAKGELVTKVSDKQIVNLKVTGNEACFGKEVTFEIWRDEMFNDEKITELATTISDEVTATWNVEWQCDFSAFGFCLDGDDQIYFVAKADDGTQVMSQSITLQPTSSGTGQEESMELTEQDGQNNNQPPTLKYYKSVLGRASNVRDVFLGDNYVGIKIVNNAIYANSTSPVDTPVATLTSGERFNVLEDRFKLIGDDETIVHLNNLNGFTYDNLINNQIVREKKQKILLSEFYSNGNVVQRQQEGQIIEDKKVLVGQTVELRVVHDCNNLEVRVNNELVTPTQQNEFGIRHNLDTSTMSYGISINTVCEDLQGTVRDQKDDLIMICANLEACPTS